jgi:hypothetical protein
LRSTLLLGMSTCPISRHSVASLIFVDRICCRSRSCRTLFDGRVLPDRWSCGQALRNLDAKVGRYLPAIDSLLTATALDHNSAAPFLTAHPRSLRWPLASRSRSVGSGSALGGGAPGPQPDAQPPPSRNYHGKVRIHRQPLLKLVRDSRPLRNLTLLYSERKNVKHN